MSTLDPAVIKRTPVRGFNNGDWSTVSYKVMQEAIAMKFSQNHYLMKELIATKGKILVEASPNDKTWGIGLGLHSPDLPIRTNGVKII